MKFVKMQGCGNDYVYFDCMQGVPQELDDKHIAAIATAVSDRHFGVGADGVVLICKSKIASARMRMFNADGSEGAMCGNASRCIGKFLYDNGYVKDTEITLETKSGVKPITLQIKNGVCVGATVFMGAVSTTGRLSYVKALGKTFGYTPVSVGNPHAVIFIEENPADYDVCGIGSCIESAPVFPEGVNVEFVKNLGGNVLDMRVWERGSGETLACGTGSCAAAFLAVKRKLCVPDKPVTVKLRGGELKIEIKADGVYMTGPAETVFTGEYDTAKK